MYSGKEFTCQCRRCRRHKFDPWVRKMPWRRKWQFASVFLPGKFPGQRSLVGYSPWGCKELYVTEHTHILYTYEYYPVIKKMEILPLVTTWINLEGIRLSEISHRMTNTI